MRTSFELMADYLSPSGGRLVMRDRASSRVESARLARGGRVRQDVLCTYILDADDTSAFRMTMRAGNYIIRGKYSSRLVQDTGAAANLTIVPLNVDEGYLLDVAEKCCKGLTLVRSCSLDLIEALSENASLEAVTSIVSRTLDNPVTLSDRSLAVVAWSNHPGATDPILEDFINKGLEESVRRWSKLTERLDSYDVSARSPIPERVTSSTGESHYVHCGVMVKGACQFSLGVAEANRTLDDHEEAALAYLSDIVGEIISGGLTPDAAMEGDDPVPIINSLMEGRTPAVPETGAGATKVRSLFASPKALASFFIEGRGASYMESQLVLGRLRAHAPRDFFFASNSMTFGLVSDPKGHDALVTRMATLLEEACGVDWKLALSFPVASPSELRVAYAQCNEARRMGLLFNPEHDVYDYMRYVCESFYERASTPEDIQEHCMPVALAILEYDEERGTAYAKTLYRYLKSYCSADAVAEEMCVHRNTIFYRLDRIRELFDVNLKNPVQMNALELAFDILFARRA